MRIKYDVIPSKSYSLCGLSGVCMVNPFMTSIFSKLGNMLHSDTPLIVAIISEGCRI